MFVTWGETTPQSTDPLITHLPTIYPQSPTTSFVHSATTAATTTMTTYEPAWLEDSLVGDNIKHFDNTRMIIDNDSIIDDTIKMNDQLLTSWVMDNEEDLMADSDIYSDFIYSSVCLDENQYLPEENYDMLIVTDLCLSDEQNGMDIHNFVLSHNSVEIVYNPDEYYAHNEPSNQNLGVQHRNNISDQNDDSYFLYDLVDDPVVYEDTSFEDDYNPSVDGDITDEEGNLSDLNDYEDEGQDNEDFHNIFSLVRHHIVRL
ncbi:unnamed protein product [Rotaria sordida]|uniref:Uncharacterized protein n=1 Tax=Rotaria sordida TaxID=392033 RepID=A0A814UB37_9BILA|nr:unnamed protein product [Rotaria sordida]CAF1172853.1 unnamed protein product [Rotaria sordida]CAF3676678.1 unnamed protein product [Rotaria sordida]CAF3705901.1 unnamed protein product [Rotaria sordida]